MDNDNDEQEPAQQGPAGFIIGILIKMFIIIGLGTAIAFWTMSTI